jgi:hypothetical protein
LFLKDRLKIAYLVVGHESPCENADLLVEWNLVHTGRQVCAMRVNHVLKVLAQPSIKRVHVALALHNLEQPVELVDCQVLDDSLRHCGDFFLRGRSV